MKRLLITGHTSGLGNAVYNRFKDNYDCTGISRSTGYDLSVRDTVDKVVEMSLAFDHVINVCKVFPAQVDLLLEIHKIWGNNNKYGKIISIGGLTTGFSWDLIRQAPVHQTDYIAAKHTLLKAHNDLSTIHPYNAQPQSVLIRPLNIGNKGNDRDSEPFNTEEEIVDLIQMTLEKNYYISTIDVRRLKCS
jgi:hypothetical protein